MTDPAAEVLDSTAPARPAGSGWAGWAAGATALALVVAATVALRPPGAAEGVALRLVEHSGSALDGQTFVRLYFSVAAAGGDADVSAVQVVLGDRRQDVVGPGRIDDGGEALVLVDLVPQCPDAVRALGAGTLDVTFSVDGDQRVARLPLPVEGSLPRLMARRCAGTV